MTWCVLLPCMLPILPAATLPEDDKLQTHARAGRLALPATSSPPATRLGSAGPGGGGRASSGEHNIHLCHSYTEGSTSHTPSLASSCLPLRLPRRAVTDPCLSPPLCCIKGLTLTTVACSGAPAGAAGLLSTCCREGLAESVYSAARKSLHLPGRVVRLRDEKHARALHLSSCTPDQPVVRVVGPDPPLRGSAGAHATSPSVGSRASDVGHFYHTAVNRSFGRGASTPRASLGSWTFSSQHLGLRVARASRAAHLEPVLPSLSAGRQADPCEPEVGPDEPNRTVRADDHEREERLGRRARLGLLLAGGGCVTAGEERGQDRDVDLYEGEAGQVGCLERVDDRGKDCRRRAGGGISETMRYD
jgi:hypothetical protein